MSDDEESLRRAIEGIIDDKDLAEAIAEDSDLPRIVVTEDSIIVLEENEWSAKNVKDSYNKVDKISDNDNVCKALEKMIGFSENVVDKNIGVSAGDVLSEVENNDFSEKKVDSYKSNLYETGLEDDYDNVGVEVGRIEDLEEIRRGGRSILEIAGFEDEAAEKRRENKREGNFI